MAKFYRGRDGRIYQAGSDRAPNGRMFVGADRAILGADYSLLGQDAPTPNEMNLAQEVALARQAGGYIGGQQTVVPVGFYQLLPFYYTVAAGATQIVSARPQRTFRIDALVVDSLEGGFFTLDSWSVGQDNMYVANGRVRCSVFSEGAAQRGLSFRGFTANQGTDVTLEFTNTDDEEHVLSGFLSGPAMMQIG